MQNITIPYNEEIIAMAKEILHNPQTYTAEQLNEIPSILEAKSRYFWGNDLLDFDLLRDVFTDEGPNGFGVDMGGGKKYLPIEEQIGLVNWSIGPAENCVPMHFGHNQIVHFEDATHAKLITRMNDRHTYRDNGEVYAGWGLYVDDMLKCKDGRWRISMVRLTYGVMENQLRAVKAAMAASENK